MEQAVSMDRTTKSRDSRNIRLFDIVIAIFIAGLTVFVALQAIKLESLRCEVKAVKQIKLRKDHDSFYKCKFLFRHLCFHSKLGHSSFTKLLHRYYHIITKYYFLLGILTSISYLQGCTSALSYKRRYNITNGFEIKITNIPPSTVLHTSKTLSRSLVQRIPIEGQPTALVGSYC